LFFFGGVSEMTQEPQDAGLEVRVAAAGPLTSFMIAGGLGGFWFLTNLVKAPVAISATLAYGALINATLGAFNLLPAFPLDGGRVFRGSVWKRSGSLVGATRTAARLSEAFSLLMMLGGFVSIIFGDFVDGIWIVVLGWFIKAGAETSLRQTVAGESLSGVVVRDIMSHQLVTVPPDLTVQQVISDYFLIHPHDSYPVVKDGEIYGIITLQSVRAIPKEERPVITVGQAMIPRGQAVIVEPTTTALDVLQQMARVKTERVLVVENRQLVGIVTRGDVMKAIQTRQVLAP
jgi:CBS domain-containing protein